MHTNRSNRWTYLDICRLAAIFSVVVIHVVAEMMYHEDLGSFRWSVLLTYSGITRFCIPMFFMVSGALLLNPDKAIPFKMLYKKYVLHLVCALLFWSAMFYIFLVYAKDPEFTMSHFVLKDFVSQVLSGHPSHHWFLFLMIGFYMLIPVFKCIVRNQTICRYYLLVWLFFGIGMTSLKLIINNLVFIDHQVLTAGIQLFDSISPGSILGLPGYMILGYYLHTYRVDKKQLRVFQALGLLAFAAIVAATYYVSVRNGALAEPFYEPNSLWMLALAVAVFVTVQARYPEPGTELYPVLSIASTYSFGVYLIHDFFLNNFNRIGFTVNAFPYFVSPIVITAIIYFLCVCVAYAIKKIPVIGRYLV